MGKDEYRNTDSDLENNLKSPANEALERLRARERPTEDDVKLGEPFYKKIADQEKIPFLMVRGGFILGFNGVLYPYYLGGDYVRQLVLDEGISAIELDSGGWVGSGGLLYSGDPEGYSEGYDDDDGYDWETTNQQAGYEEVLTRKDLRLYLAEIKKLEDQGFTEETNHAHLIFNEDLAFYKKELWLTTHQGRIQNADPEGRKIQQRVFHNIHNWYKKMEGEEYGTDESRIIMAYFRKHIITGRTCYHTGPWKFKCF